MSASGPADRSFRALVRACFSPRQMEELAESLMTQALSGSVEAARLLLIYRDGRPPDAEDSAPTRIIVTLPTYDQVRASLPEPADAEDGHG